MPVPPEGATVSDTYPDTPVLTPTPNPARPPVRGLSWQDRAACVHADPELFFGPDQEGRGKKKAREKKAVAVCAACPVRSECDQFAAASGVKYGVFGGKTEQERSCKDGYCGSGTHPLTLGNRGAQGKCLPCRREAKAAKRGELAAAS